MSRHYGGSHPCNKTRNNLTINKGDKMNYLVARVSDPEQRKALPAQKKKLYDYAEFMKWKEGKDFTYVEFDETAFKENRKSFRELVIEPLQNEKELAIAVFDKIDRFSRDTTGDERKDMTTLFKQGRIELHFPSDNLFINRTSPAADLFRLDIGVALASYYSASIRNNVQRRYAQMLNDGIWVGKAPIGYLNYQVYGENGKIISKGIKLDPERAHLIHEAFELRASGAPYKTIAKEMKKRGLTNNTKMRKPPTSSQWEQIFRNKFYIGTMKFEGKEYEHHYDKLIEKWLWDKCQKVTEERGSFRTKHNTRSHSFLFKNLKCHHCGYAITFFEMKNKGITYGHCTEYGGKHGAPYVNEKLIIQQVRDALTQVTVPKSELPRIVNEIEKNHASEQKYYLAARTRLQKEYNRLDEELDQLFTDRRQFASQHERFERLVKKLEQRQKDIQSELEDHSDGDKAFVIGASYILEVCSRAVELFDAESTSIEQKRYLINFVLSNLTLDGKTLHFKLLAPFDVIAECSKTNDWYPGLGSNQ